MATKLAKVMDNLNKDLKDPFTSAEVASMSQRSLSASSTPLIYTIVCDQSGTRPGPTSWRGRSRVTD